jgi:DNA-binding GntR family transcriptional regulator
MSVPRPPVTDPIADRPAQALLVDYFSGRLLADEPYEPARLARPHRTTPDVLRAALVRLGALRLITVKEDALVRFARCRAEDIRHRAEALRDMAATASIDHAARSRLRELDVHASVSDLDIGLRFISDLLDVPGGHAVARVLAANVIAFEANAAARWELDDAFRRAMDRARKPLSELLIAPLTGDAPRVKHAILEYLSHVAEMCGRPVPGLDDVDVVVEPTRA